MMGVVAGRCGDDEAALGHYRRALETNENYCGARVGVGLADMRAGRTQPARQHFERAIREDNQCTAAYVNLAIIQRTEDNEVRESLNNLRRALAIESDYLPAFNQMALLYLGEAEENQQMLDLAEVVCRQAQLINANYAPIYNTWGLINVRQGNIIAALREVRARVQPRRRLLRGVHELRSADDQLPGLRGRIARLHPGPSSAWQSYDAVIGLGAAQRGLNQLDAAEATYRAAVEMDGQRPEAYYNLGLLYQDFKGGQIPDLRQANQFYEQFTQRAASNQRFAENVEGVTRRCRRRPTRGRRRRREGQSEWVGNCRPGRSQQIEESIRIQTELQEMQQQMQQQQQQQGGAAAAPEGG